MVQDFKFKTQEEKEEKIKGMKNFLFTILFILVGLGLGLSPIFFLYHSVKAESLTTSVYVIICGNGILEAGEVCDDGADNGTYGPSISQRYCNSTCDGYAPYCGDGIVQGIFGEECDDGNNDNGDGCSATCSNETTPSPGGGGAGAIIPQPETKVVLKGLAYPNTWLNVLKDGEIVKKVKTDETGEFRAEISDLNPGTYSFALWAKDKLGTKSITYALTFQVSKGVTTTIQGIILPPTISLDKTELHQGDLLKIFGQTIPQKTVEVHISSSETVKKILSDKKGLWNLPLDTGNLEKGSHQTKARVWLNKKEKSGFSQVLSFNIGKALVKPESPCSKSDLNKDGEVNLIDFSIMLYWWGKHNAPADLNGDDMVNLVDFSILLYCWTG